MISPGRVALSLLVGAALIMFPPTVRRAEADGSSSAAVNAIWLDYVRSHMDDEAVTGPLSAEAPASSRAITEILMKNRPSKHLHMFGDDHLNLEPRRIGPLGFGLSAGGEF